MKPLAKWQIVALILLGGYGTRDNWLPNLVQPITVKVDLPGFYSAWADILRRDASSLVTTTGKFRSAYVDSAKLLVSGTDYERVAGRDKAISDKIVRAIGLDDRPFDTELREKLADALDAIGDSL